MSIANTHIEETVATLYRRIVEAEMRSTEATHGLAAQIRSGAETVEAERRIGEGFAELLVLRRQLWELQSRDET